MLGLMVPGILEILIVGVILLLLVGVPLVVCILVLSRHNSVAGGKGNLVPCPECGHHVSPSASACPQCGFPLKSVEQP